MSWHTGTMGSVTAGSLITVLDSVLLTNSYWSIYDAAAGTNAKVYRCYDPYGPTDFYIKVDNNYTQYAIIEMWEGWDSDAHTGIGNSLIYASSSYVLRLYYDADYRIRLNDFNFHFMVTGMYGHYFFGRPDSLFDETKNIVLLVSRSTSTSFYNPFGSGSSNSNQVVCRFLFDENGIVNNARFRTHIAMVDISGNGVFTPKITVGNDTTKLIVGYINDAASMFSSDESTLNHGDTLTVSGETWEAIKSPVGELAVSLHRVGA